MSEDTVHRSRRTRSRRAIASYLRRVADAFGRGEPVPVDEEQTVTVDPPADPELAVEVEREGEDLTLAIEMEWPDERGVVDTDADASKATFELYADRSEQWRWRLVHDNGNIIADSGEGYASRQKARQGIESVKTNAPGAPVLDQSKDNRDVDTDDDTSDGTFELYEDTGENWRWRLVHDNGEIVADSGQGYAARQNAKKGLQSVRKNAVGASVEEQD